MAPKKKGRTARECFLQYSSDARHQVDRITKALGRKEAEKTYRAIKGTAKTQLSRALEGKEAARVELASCKEAVTRARTEKNNLARKNGADRSNRKVVAAFDGWLDRQKEVIHAQEDLKSKSQALTEVINTVYTTQGMKDFAQTTHAAVESAAQQSEADMIQMLKSEGELRLPQTSNREIKIPENWLPDEKKKQRKEYVKQKFPYERFRPGSGTVLGWIGGWPIPAGGHSRVAIWVEDDGYGSIKNRVLRKDTDKTAESWADVNSFDNLDFRAREDPNLLIPMEVACHRDLSSIQGSILGQSVAVPNLQGFKVEVENERYIMYLDYCGRGNLHQLIDKYGRITSEQTRHIPEPFLWRVFLALAVTGYAMERGTLDPKEENAEWKQIVHRDLKITNIFLDEPTSDHFQSYPAVRVGDFGIAVKTSEKDVLNPITFYQWRCTPQWEPPEGVPFVDLRNCKPVQRFKQLAPSNVYGIGMIILALMTLTHTPAEKQWLGDGPEDMHMVDAPEYRARTSRYSKFLRRKVQECIQFYPQTRITCGELLDDIETFLSVDDEDDDDDGHDDVEGDDEDMGKATKRRKERTHGSLLDGHELLHCERDIYVRAMRLASLPLREPEPDLQWYNA